MARMNPPKPRQPTKAELERAAQIAAYRQWLDDNFPPVVWRQLYGCNLCGLAIFDRQAHFATAHSESKFFNMLKELFDGPHDS